MKKVVFVALGIALAIVFINDLGAYVSARRAVIEATRQAADTAAGAAQSGRDAAARAAAETAAQQGVTVYLYDQDDTRVEVWGRIEITGSWVYAPAAALLEGRPRDELPVLESYSTTPIR
ncbi:MAG TPA: hypothetical protein VFH17_03115 [Coriobacteriia bacterium]|nr:hypothetical protein [Coriobacteriia bacterium]